MLVNSQRYWMLVWLCVGLVLLTAGWALATYLTPLSPYRAAAMWLAFGLPPLGFLAATWGTRCATAGGTLTAGLLIVMVAAVSIGFDAGRRWSLLHYGGPTADAEWEQWREQVARQAETANPVTRRVPSSAEPPLRVLMRDHYDVCLLGALLLSTALFGFCWVVTLGLVSGRTRIYDDQGRRES